MSFLQFFLFSACTLVLFLVLFSILSYLYHQRRWKKGAPDPNEEELFL